MGPSPRPAGPWQTRQNVSYRNRPRLIDSDVRVLGFASRSAVCRLISGSTPVTGTVPGTGGVRWGWSLGMPRLPTGGDHTARYSTASGDEGGANTDRKGA